jgi:hypothetical protein
VTAQGEGRLTEPYDPIPDIIDRAERRPDGLAGLKAVARFAFGQHQPTLTWVTDGVSKDPATGELLWKAATACSCGTGCFPCAERTQLTAIFGLTEEER